MEAAARGLEACGYDPAVRVRFQAEAGIEAVAKLIAALPAHEQEMVVGGNAAEVFRLGR